MSILKLKYSTQHLKQRRGEKQHKRKTVTEQYLRFLLDLNIHLINKLPVFGSTNGLIGHIFKLKL